MKEGVEPTKRSPFSRHTGICCKIHQNNYIWNIMFVSWGQFFNILLQVLKSSLPLCVSFHWLISISYDSYFIHFFGGRGCLKFLNCRSQFINQHLCTTLCILNHILGMLQHVLVSIDNIIRKPSLTKFLCSISND